MDKDMPVTKTEESKASRTVASAGVSSTAVLTEKVSVVLIAEHEHAGELKQPGDSIEVTQRQHEWLRTHGKVE